MREERFHCLLRYATGEYLWFLFVWQTGQFLIPLLPGENKQMRNLPYILRPMMIMVSVAFLLAGCSGLSRKADTPEDAAAMAQARIVLHTLAGQNEKLTSFKGIGKIRLWQNGQKKIDERIAWIGSEAVKLSIVVLVSGHPAIKMASDGKWFYYYEARQNEPIYKKRPATDASLQRIVSIPIKVSDIVELLAGRTPLRDHHSALLVKQSSGPGYVLSLKKRWWGIVEKIILAEDKTRVHQIEFFNRSGTLIYRARFDEMQFVAGYQVPARLSISNDEGIDFQLQIERYLADVPISPSMFVLNPPD